MISQPRSRSRCSSFKIDESATNKLEMRLSYTLDAETHKTIVGIKRKTPASTSVTAIQLHPHRYMCKPIHWSKTDVTCLDCRFEFMKNNSVLVCVSSKNLNSVKQYNDIYHFMYKSLLMKLPFRITSSQSCCLLSLNRYIAKLQAGLWK